MFTTIWQTVPYNHNTCCKNASVNRSEKYDLKFRIIASSIRSCAERKLWSHSF